MALNQKLLNELKDILREDFGKELNEKELFEIGNSLVLYFDLLAKINFRNQMENKPKEFDFHH